MLMSRLRTHTHTDGNVKVEQYSSEADSAIEAYVCFYTNDDIDRHCIVAKQKNVRQNKIFTAQNAQNLYILA